MRYEDLSFFLIRRTEIMRAINVHMDIKKIGVVVIVINENAKFTDTRDIAMTMDSIVFLPNR